MSVVFIFILYLLFKGIQIWLQEDRNKHIKHEQTEFCLTVIIWLTFHLIYRGSLYSILAACGLRKHTFMRL